MIWLPWLLWRVLRLVGLLFLVSCVLFFIFHIVGGDPTHALVGKNANRDMIEAVRIQLGLEQPLGVQFLVFVKQAFMWDWGTSWVSHQSVSVLIAEGMGPSLIILFSSLITSVLMAYFLSLWTLYKKGGYPEVIVRWCMSLLMSFHFVALVILMQYLLSYHFNLFPVYGWEKGFAGLRYAVLPFLIHTIAGVAPKYITLRALLGTESELPYVRTAMAKGCSPWRTSLVHITANILPGVITLIMAQLPAVLAGSIVLEVFWGIPGLGLLLMNAIQASDFPVIKAMTFLSAGFYIFTVFVGDVFIGWSLKRTGDL